MRPGRLVIIGCLIVLLIGCAQENGPRQVMLNTPAQHVSSGLTLLQANAPVDAMREFNAALALDTNYAGAYVGLSMASTYNRRFDDAKDHLIRAERLAQEDWELTQIEIARMDLNMTEAKPGWLQRVEAAYTRATNLTPQAARATYMLALAYLKIYRFDLAGIRFQQVASMDDSLAFVAQEGVLLCNKVIEAAPKTKLAKQTALIRHIDRAELAALLVAEIDINWPKPPSNVQTTDVGADLPQANAIHRVVAAKIPGLTVHGGGEFVPPLLVKRQELAMVAAGIASKIAGRDDLGAGCLVQDIEDMPTDEENSKAICIALEHRLMNRLAWGRFNSRGLVSGATALVVIRRAERLGRVYKEH